MQNDKEGKTNLGTSPRKEFADNSAAVLSMHQLCEDVLTTVEKSDRESRQISIRTLQIFLAAASPPLRWESR